MIPGLPPIDIPDWLLEPRSCKACKHMFYQSADRDLRYPRCGRARHSQQCRYERHETGECGPDAIYWTGKAV